MKISNPQGDFIRVEKDVNGEPEYGFRETFGQEEIVNLKTGKSNMNFYKPDMVLNPQGCKHNFKIEDIRKREFVCKKCSWGVTVNIDQIEENEEGMFINMMLGRFKVYQ